MEVHCPVCDQKLEQTENSAHCATCDKDFPLVAHCPECHKPLEVLKACGAVDYFCQNGHGLISRKRVDWQPVA